MNIDNHSLTHKKIKKISSAKRVTQIRVTKLNHDPLKTEISKKKIVTQIVNKNFCLDLY